MYFLIEHRNEITMQVSYDSLDSKLLKPTRNHGPTPGPQKGVQSLKRNMLRNRMLQRTVVHFSDVAYGPLVIFLLFM